MASPSSWSDLPEDILVMIKNLLQSPSDITRFRSVCPSWRSSTPPFKNTFPFPDVFLDNITQTCNNLNQITIYCFQPLIHPSPSPPSWFIAVEFVAGKHHFRNALTSLQLDIIDSELPKQLNLCDFRITELKKLYGVQSLNNSIKALFIDSQYYDETLLVVFGSNFTRDLVFYRLEGTQWVFLKNIDDMGFTDVEVYQGRVFGVGFEGRTVVFTSSLDTIEIAPRLLPDEEEEGAYFHFIESSGALYIVEFNEDVENGIRSGSIVFCGKNGVIPVKVYKVDVEENRCVVVRDLDDRVFVFALEFPLCFSLASRESPGGMKNCIVKSAASSSECDSDDTFVRMEYCVWDMGKDKYDGLDYELRKLFWPPPNWFITGSSCE